MDSKALEALVADYKKTLPEKARKIEELAVALREQKTLDSLIALRTHVHKLAGSAGTYGFADISTLCRAEEKKLQELIERGDMKALSPSFFEGLSTFIQHLKEKALYGSN